MKTRGFTLIELVVVMAIIAILTGLSVFNFNQARMKARDISRKNDLKQLQNALELYKNEQFPQTFPAALASLTPTYIKVVPVDPKEKSLSGSWTAYTYTQLTGLTYTLTACLENKGDPDKLLPEVLCASGNGVIYQLTTP